MAEIMTSALVHDGDSVALEERDRLVFKFDEAVETSFGARRGVQSQL